MSDHDWEAAANALWDLGTALLHRRELLGISVRRAARDAGVGFNTISRIERGYGFDSRSAIAIMEWLGSPGPSECDLPPAGWWCSREHGHDGPCAARRTTDA